MKMATTATRRTRRVVRQPIPRQLNVPGVRWNRLTSSNGSSCDGGCESTVTVRVQPTGNAVTESIHFEPAEHLHPSREGGSGPIGYLLQIRTPLSAASLPSAQMKRRATYPRIRRPDK